MNRLKTVQAWQFTLQNIDGNEKATETGWIPQERKCKPEKAKAKKKGQYQETSGSLCVDSALYPVIGALIIVKIKS
jgi:hypothetical protein